MQEPGEIIEHVGAERECKAVDVRLASASRQDSQNRNRSLKRNRDDEHCNVAPLNSVCLFHKVRRQASRPRRSISNCPLPQRGSLGSIADRLYLLLPVNGEAKCSGRCPRSRWSCCWAYRPSPTEWTS